MRCRGPVLTRRRAPQFGWTPLCWAAMQGHPEVARLLLKAGADVSATTTVSERSVGDGGMGVRTSRDFGEG